MPPVIRSGPVRYARAERFEPPRPTDPRSPEPTDDAICPQAPSRLEAVVGPFPETHRQDEDCLSLSIVAPDTPGPHPVLVFFHGGAFTTGSGLLSWYDGAALAAEQQVVVVSASYRLGPFGWLLLDGVSPGNLGLLDQVAALQWVHAGIDRFGGDPEQITVSGQSAGGMSVGYLLETPARAVVRRAIAQSGPPFDAIADTGVDAATRIGHRFAELLDADPRTAPAADLVDAAGRLAGEEHDRRPGDILPPFRMVRGAEPVPSPPALPNDPADLDLMVGWTQDEMTAFGVDLVDAQVPSERLFGAPWFDTAPRLEAAGARVVGYRLDWRPRGSPYGAVHCLELPLLLGDETAWRESPMLAGEPWSDVDRMGRQLRAAWAEFVRTGRLNPALTLDVDVAWAVDGDVAGLAVAG